MLRLGVAVSRISAAKHPITSPQALPQPLGQDEGRDFFQGKGERVACRLLTSPSTQTLFI